MTRRATRFVVHLLGTLVGIVVILLAAATWRLSQGPVVLGNITPYLEAALNQDDRDFRLGIDQAVLTWGDWQHALEVRAFGVRGIKSDGGVAFSAKEVIMDLALPPLLRGELRPLNVAVVNPWIRVIRTADGSISLDIGADQPAPPTVDGGAQPRLGRLRGGDIMEAILAAGETIPALNDLTDLTIVDADLWIDDRYLDVLWNAPEANLTLTRSADGIRLDIDMQVRFDDGDVPIEATAIYEPGSGIVDAGMTFGRVSIARLFDLLPMMPEVDGIKALVSGQVMLQLDGDLALLGGTYGLEAGAGEIGLPTFFEAPIGFNFAAVRGTLRRHLSGIELSEFRVETDQALVTGHAVLDGFEPESMAELQIQLSGLAVDALPAYWPISSATTARKWAIEHLAGGTLDEFTFNVAWTLDDLARGKLPFADLMIDGHVSGATITYLSDMPPIEGVDAHILVGDNRMRAETEGGKLLGLDIDTGLVVIEPIDTDSRLVLDLTFDGPIQDTLELAAHPRLGFADDLGLGPENVEGSAAGQLEVELPRLVGVTFSEIVYRISAEVSGVALPSGLRGYVVERGFGTVTLGNDGIALLGEIALDDVPFQVSLEQSFTGGDAPHRVMTLDARMDQADLARLEIPSIVTIEGPVDLTIGMVESWHGQVTWDVAVDMAPARVVFPLLGLDKPAGDSARLDFGLIDDGGEVIDLIGARLDTADVTVAGDGELQAGSLNLRRLNFERLAFGRSDLVGSLTVDHDGSYDVMVNQGEFDLVPFMEDITSASGPELPTFRLNGRLDRVWLTGDDSLAAVDLAALYQGDIWENLDMTGELASGAPMTIRIWRHDESERRFVYTAADAGDAMRLFDLFDDASGGTIDLRAKINDSLPERPATGAIRMNDITMTKAPILAQLLSLASLTSIANAVSGEGLVFKSALIPFRKDGNLVRIEDARAFGPGIGITVEGEVDLAARRIGPARNDGAGLCGQQHPGRNTASGRYPDRG